MTAMQTLLRMSRDNNFASYCHVFSPAVDLTGDVLAKPQVPGTVLILDCSVGYTPNITDDNNATQCDGTSLTWTTTGFKCRGMILLELK